MKKLCFILCLMLIAPCAYGAITWDKSWSSASDGSTFGGNDIKNIQDNVSDQASTNAGDNTFTGTNTFSGSTIFTGTTTGVGAAKDAITRGFELVWGSKEQVIVNVGTLYHGTTQINKTSNVHLDVTTATDYVTGVSQQTTTDWAYVYVDSSGNVKLDIAEPDKSDAAGDTEGNLIYYYYAAKTTYHRCIGAVYLNATGSGEIDNFRQVGKNTMMWDVPVAETTTKSSAEWSGALAVRIPTISTLGIFGFTSVDADGDVAMYIRPQGSTWIVDSFNGNTGQKLAGAQMHCATDSSQQIQYYNDTDSDSIAIYSQGYVMDIR